MKHRINFLAIAALAVLVGCSEDKTPSGPNNTGSINTSVYVAVGNSITAGYQSGALYEAAQQYSMTNLIAQQLGTNCVQPIFPGSGTGSLMRITSLTPVTIVKDPNSMIPPSNIDHPAPYNNLGIPGAIMYDGLDTAEINAKSQKRANPFFRLILRDQGLFGASQVLQAIKLHPTVMTLWLGNNDVLGYATSGGVSPSTFTPQGTFGAMFSNTVRLILDSLPNISLVCGNIPDVRVIPFFTTVGPMVAPILAQNNVSLAYQRHGEPTVGTGTTRLIPGANDALITLTGSPYAPLIGQATGKWYRDLADSKGVPPSDVLPAGIDTTKPFGLHPLNPWPDALILDNTELTQINLNTQQYNDEITRQINTIQTQRTVKIGLVNIYNIFNKINIDGYSVAGEKLTTAYVSGGLFSLDGVHPSSKGMGVLANEFIKVMNATFGANIPQVDISRIPGLRVPLGKSGLRFDLSWQIPPGAFDDMVRLFQR
jgi:lysophospholipase L1-like esterase